MSESEPEAEPEKIETEDFDRDSLHILPLSIIPLETSALKRARLIKNVRLKSAVELFSGISTGSGQLDLKGVGKEFELVKSHPDMVVLHKLAELNSYDVYSLRILLRAHGIEIENHDDLKLSKSKNQELTGYMKKFTYPLIVQIYGSDDVSIKEFKDVIRLFQNPDPKTAAEKLKIMADKLEIEIDQVPVFLEDYGDIFLSLAYYRRCLEEIEPIVEIFLRSLEDIQSNYQAKTDQNLMRTCVTMHSTIKGLVMALNARFEHFDHNTKDMWDDLTAERFRQVERMIKNYHTTMGGALCALSVKMNTWDRLFPSEESGGPVRRAEFIMSDMKQGIEIIQEIEEAASKPAIPEQS